MRIAILILISLLSTFSNAQKKIKDTLFFKYDKEYIITHVEIPNHFYIKDGSGVSIGNFYFTEQERLKNRNTKSKEICLEKFIRTSKFYDENRRLKLNDYALWEYFKDYTIVLVKNVHGKKEYIQVEPSFEIE